MQEEVNPKWVNSLHLIETVRLKTKHPKHEHQLKAYQKNRLSKCPTSLIMFRRNMLRPKEGTMASSLTTYRVTSISAPPPYPESLENTTDTHTLKVHGYDSCSNGMACESKENYDQALHWYFISLDCAERLGDKKIKCSLYINIANTYLSLGNQEEAFKYYGLSLKNAENRQDHEDMKKAYYSIGNAYHSFEDFSKAIEFYNKYISLRNDSDDPELLAKIYCSIGAAYHSLFNYPIALQHYQKFLHLSKEIKYQEGIDMANKNIEEVKSFLRYRE